MLQESIGSRSQLPGSAEAMGTPLNTSPNLRTPPPNPYCFLQSLNHNTRAHISWSLVTCLPMSLDCPISEGRDGLSVSCVHRAGVGPGRPHTLQEQFWKGRCGE